MRRKHAALLQAGAADVAHLEAGVQTQLARLDEAWRKYAAVNSENAMLRAELQALHDAAVRPCHSSIWSTCVNATQHIYVQTKQLQYVSTGW